MPPVATGLAMSVASQIIPFWFQFFPGEEHVVVLPALPTPEIWPLHLCTAATDAQYSV